MPTSRYPAGMPRQLFLWSCLVMLAACATENPHVPKTESLGPPEAQPQLQSGRQLYARRCAACHNGLFEPAHRSPEEWAAIVHKMARPRFANLTQEEEAAVAAYLQAASRAKRGKK